MDYCSKHGEKGTVNQILWFKKFIYNMIYWIYMLSDKGKEMLYRESSLSLSDFNKLEKRSTVSEIVGV